MGSLILRIDKGQSVGTVKLLKTSDGFEVASPVYSNEQITQQPDSSIIDVSIDGSGNIVVSQPKAVGSTSFTVQAQVDYNDANVGQTTVTKSAVVNVTVNAAPQLQETELTIVFGPQA